MTVHLWQSSHGSSHPRLHRRLPVYGILRHPSADGQNLTVYNDRGASVDQTGFLSTRADPELAELVHAVIASLPNTDEVLKAMMKGHLAGNAAIRPSDEKPVLTKPPPPALAVSRA